MKIVMFSINPIFPDVVTGGASKHLYQIACHLGEIGHDVKILCAEPGTGLNPFSWSKNVQIFPILPFNIPFPQPYNVSGADLSLIIERISSALLEADRFYIHDGELLLPDVYSDIPTVISFRDNIYPESVLGSFIGKADDVICVSKYSANVIKHTAGRFYPELAKRIHQVNNGIDFNDFKPVDPEPLARELGVNPNEEILLLHPHRPEPGKGLPETIMVTDRLIHQYGLENIKVLIPGWIDSMISTGDSNFYNEMMRLMQDLGVEHNFQFIPWQPIERMPELYSLGAVTLCLGNIVEAFGNVAYESIACATPSVVARVGVHRTLMPDEIINKVDYGDIEGAVKQLMAIINGNEGVGKDALAYLKATMDVHRQMVEYTDIITSCQKRDKLRFSPPEFKENQAYMLAPWCYFHENEVYHDFRGAFIQAPDLADMMADAKLMTKADAVDAGIPEGTWDMWVKHTLVIPVQNE